MVKMRNSNKRKAQPDQTDQETAKRQEREELYDTWPPARRTRHFVQIPGGRYAIMQILTSEPTVTARIMKTAPRTESVRQADPWITDGEFFHMEGYVYDNLDKSMFSGPAPMASLATRAVGIGGNFTRDSILKKDGLRTQPSTTQCCVCESPLQAIDFFHCRKCNSFGHNKCTYAAERGPFQIIGASVCDNTGTPVECPKCPKGSIFDDTNITTYHDTITEKPFRISILLDIGSKNTRVAFRLRVGSTDSPWETLGEPILSSIWITEERHAIKTSTNQIDREEISANLRRFSPFKRLLYDAEYLQEAITFGQGRTAESIFQDFFKGCLNRIAVEAGDKFRPFMEDAKENAARAPAELPHLPPVDCRVMIATPAKVVESEKCSFLTGLFQASTAFFAFHYGVADIRPTIYDLPEPEMALAGIDKAGFWRDGSPGLALEDRSRWIVNWDIGGSTWVRIYTFFSYLSLLTHMLQDFALVKQLPDQHVMRIRYYGVDSVYCGNINSVNEMINTPQLKRDPYVWDRLVTWVQDVIDIESSNTNTAIPLFQGRDLSNLWRRIRKAQLEEAETFIKKSIDIVKERVPREEHDSIEFFLSGGGLLDRVINARFQQAISDQFPNPNIGDSSFSRLS